MDDDTSSTAPAVTTTSSENRQAKGDPELIAIDAIVAALGPLKDEQRTRALEYILRRFSVALPQSPTALAQPPSFSPPALSQAGVQSAAPAPGVIHDIRSLKEAKTPKSANEMAALVAYYVSELAPGADRKNEITKSDIERYFKTAGFSLPADANFTLVNAKNAGYLDSAGAGQYKLNPVGYNLVVHRMGNRNSEKKERGRAKKSGTKRHPRQAKKALRVAKR